MILSIQNATDVFVAACTIVEGTGLSVCAVVGMGEGGSGWLNCHNS